MNAGYLAFLTSADKSTEKLSLESREHKIAGELVIAHVKYMSFLASWTIRDTSRYSIREHIAAPSATGFISIKVLAGRIWRNGSRVRDGRYGFGVAL